MASSRSRARKRAHLIAYAMWGVLGLLVLTLGVLMGLAYVENTGEEKAADVPVQTTPDDVGPGTSTNPTPGKSRVDPKPDRKPRVVPKPRPRGLGPVVPDPDPKPQTIPRPVPRPEPVAPKTLEEAGGSEAEQQAMLDTDRAMIARAEGMAQGGPLTEEEGDAIAALKQSGRATLAEREAAYAAKRWPDVLRLTREKIANTDELDRYLNGVEARQRQAKRAAEEAAKRLAALPSPAVQKIHDLLEEASKARESSRALKTKNRTTTALSKTLEEAWSLTSRLQDADLAHQAPLRMFIQNSRGECQEVIAEFAKHRRPQEAMKIRVLSQGHAVMAYERALKIEGDAKYATDISAKAWALHRIAVLSTKIAKHHEETLASYTKFKRSYPQAYLIARFKEKSHDAITRLQADFPKATDPSGRLLSTIVDE